MQSNDELVDYLKSQGALYDEAVEEAMRRVDRLAFVGENYRNNAYDDRPLPTKLGQTISAPHMVAIMTQHLSVMPGMKILEIGAGFGYQSAVLSEMVGPEGEVHTIEHLPIVAEAATKNLRAYSNVSVTVSNGINGLKKEAPFDRIMVTAAAQAVPAPLMDQLAEDGKMVIPIGHGAVQRLTLVEKIAGQPKKTDLNCTCIFVPLVG